MRLVADTPEDYKALARCQKLITSLWKAEEPGEHKDMLKAFMNCPLEKSYEQPGKSVEIAKDAELYTEEKELFIPYIVHAAVNRKKMAMQYRSNKGEVKNRLVEPFTWRNGSLVAFCHEAGSWRNFKPANITALAVTNHPFDRDEEVEIVASDAKDKADLINK